MSDTRERKPYSDMIVVANEIKRLLEPHCERIEIAGSLRRKCETIGDVEIVCIPKPFGTGLFESGFAKVVNQWEKVRGEPTGKYTARIFNGHKVDIFIAEPRNWGYILAIRTGSSDYSHKVLATGWVKKGYVGVNGYLCNAEGNTIIEVHEEIDLFDLIGIQYCEPENRNV